MTRPTKTMTVTEARAALAAAYGLRDEAYSSPDVSAALARARRKIAAAKRRLAAAVRKAESTRLTAQGGAA